MSLLFNLDYRRHKNEVASTELQQLTSALDTVPQTPSPRYLTKGWRFGLINCAISASIVFLLNLVVTVLWGVQSKGGVLFEGDCDRARKINSGLHILINALSTILLSSSNYCMQCLSAPTRNEVDRAHSRGKWLDIGVLSIGNLRCISKKRVILWSLLGLSSLPLHLFYNSAVYMSIAAYDYQVYAVGSSFLDSANCPNCVNTTSGEWTYMKDSGVQDVHLKAREGRLERLENIDCINAYAKMLQSGRGDLLLVAKDDAIPLKKGPRLSETSPVFWYYYFGGYFALGSYWQPTETYKWICSSLTDQKLACAAGIEQVRATAANWTVGGSCIYDIPFFDRDCTRMIYMQGPIEYCLSEKIQPQCKVRWSIPIAALVTTLNLVKAILIFYTAFSVNEEPLLTLGDAITSFITREDRSTTNMCLTSIKDMDHTKRNFNAGPRRWIGKQYYWKDATSKSRRAFTILMIIVSVIFVSGLLGYALYRMDPGQSRSLSSLASIGFGALDTRTIIRYQISSVIGNTLIANLAQVVLSVVYFSYNSLFTCMLLGQEWASYAYERKGLRVSTKPTGAQRSTYFLSLPYRFALPLMAMSGMLHWLVSQSIFFVAIEVSHQNARIVSFLPSLYVNSNNDSNFTLLVSLYQKMSCIRAVIRP